MDIKVLYEDNHIIAVYKPAGVLTQADETGDLCLLEEVKKYLKNKYKKPGKVFLGLLHRLDRNVSGIILFAKTSKGASRLSEQFRNNSIKKTYHAVVLDKLKNKGTLKNYIQKDEQKRIAKIFDKENNNNQLAILDYEVAASNKNYSLVKIGLKTGKFHQIRAQFANIGNPVVGDIKYGAPFSLKDKSICLCATSIKFLTAVNENEKEISIDIPKEWREYISF